MKVEISAARQIRFHQLLVSARKTWLRDALTAALAVTDPNELKKEVITFVPADVQQILAASGIRDELVFPVPILLRNAPTLVGYYRLLLGVPQKTFYGPGTGMGLLKSMETKGLLRPRHEQHLEEFCRTMTAALGDLVREISPTITQQDIVELPLLTLGSQFQGGNNNYIGKQATVDVFLAVSEIVREFVVDRTDSKLIITNSAGRRVVITLAGDPDIRIEEDTASSVRKIVAVEIKGGTDKSNAHNRAGEAEKSHQKAKQQGFRDFWTIIATRSLDLNTLRAESPTTNEWYDVAQVLARSGPDWTHFCNSIASLVGIPLE